MTSKVLGGLFIPIGWKEFCDSQKGSFYLRPMGVTVAKGKNFSAVGKELMASTSVHFPVISYIHLPEKT